jgi:hypothetical protein
MADQKKSESHAAFYIVMACIAIGIAGGGYWWFTTNNTDADKEQTAQLNGPAHPKKPATPAPSASAAPAAAPTDNK